MNKAAEYRIIVDIPPTRYRAKQLPALAVLRQSGSGWAVADLPAASPLGQKYIAKARNHRRLDAMFQMITTDERDEVHRWWESEALR